MNVNYFLSPYAALTQNMVAKIYEVETSGVVSEVDSITIPERDSGGIPTPGAGHQVPYAVSFTGRDFITHEVRLYTAGGTLLHRYDVMPTKDTVTIFDPIRFRIGDGGPNTPAAGATAYVNTAMAGLLATDYIAIRTGYGPVIEGIHITNNVLGGFQLFQPGDVFSGDPAEEWTIIMQPKVLTAPVNDSVVGKMWGPTALLADSFLDVNTTVTYVPGHLRKLIRLAGHNAIYKFESSDVPPIGYVFRFTNFGSYTPGNPDPKVQFNNAALKWGNTTLTELSIPLYTTSEFYWDGTQWNATIHNPQPVSTAVAGDIVGNGRFTIGDVSETTFTVTHGLNLAYAYRVLGVIYSRNANPARDNTVTFAVREFTNNSFKVTIQEIFGEVQTIDFDWIIVKA